MSIAQLLGTRTNVSQSNNSYVNPAILNLLQSRKMVQLMDYYTDLCYIIMTTVKISAFEIMLIRN
jgi:glutaminase